MCFFLSSPTTEGRVSQQRRKDAAVSSATPSNSDGHPRRRTNVGGPNDEKRKERFGSGKKPFLPLPLSSPPSYIEREELDAG